MFAKLAVTLSALAILAGAIPAPGHYHPDHGNTNVLSQCNVGNAQCCNSVESAQDPSTAALLGLLGIAVGNINGQVGLGCTVVTGIGAGQGANCAQQPVCCTQNQFNGLVNLGCNPISL